MESSALGPGLIGIAYLVSSVLFVYGLKGLSHPRTAVRANLLGASGMALAIVVTLLDPHISRYGVIFAGLAVGAAIGGTLAARVQMTAMPQMVALLNGFGGAASLLVGGGALVSPEHSIGVQEGLAVGLSGLVGSVTFWGSLVAYGKLEEWKSLRKTGNLFAGQLAVNAGLLLLSVALSAYIASNGNHWSAWVAFFLIFLAGSALGVLLVVSIGGADMPVVIALMNSYSGIAGSMTGFVINNTVLIIAGSLVGASGIILTAIMCKAMNRSLTNVLFGTLGPTGDTPTADEVYAGKIKSAGAEEIAMLLEGAQRVVIVPGYGMAVSQAQHAVRDLAVLLEGRGATVEFAIHPVAGRMPGHMNILLAEADIDYEKLREMDDINPSMAQVDVAIVVGANDVVNPVARTDPTSPIAGMPIIDVDKARTVVVVKRSLAPGFAGIPNPLFAADNTLMYFADGKQAFLDLIGALKELG